MSLTQPGCGDDDSPPIRQELVLPGDQFYPESVSAGEDGSVYASSVLGGQVVRFAPGALTAEPFISGDDFAGGTGVLADSAHNRLLLCAVDLNQLLGGEAPTSEVRIYDLTTGALQQRLPIEGASFCNDFAVTADGTVYVADSLGRILRLPSGASALETWSSDALLASTAPGGFGADGIAWDGGDTLYVNTFTDGSLLRLRINSDGSAAAAEPITVSPPLSSPDGMRAVDVDRLLVVNGAGSLVQLSIAGNAATATTLRDGLNQPSSVVVTGDETWVSEGQIGVLFGLVQGPPITPFRLVNATPVE